MIENKSPLMANIENSIHSEILSRIKHAEDTHNVKVLYAVESGSRAWGFPSKNSDYDVRFIYLHPRDWYLSIDHDEKRDVIEYPILDEIDINGWELRKALLLLKGSNPTMGEWLHSPIVYIDENNFQLTAQKLFEEQYKTERGLYHYIHMAKKNYQAILKSSNAPIKKYLYILRAICSAKWIHTYKKPPPIEFASLLESVIENSELLDLFNTLIEQKKNAYEQALIIKNLELNAFIESELEWLYNNIKKTEVAARDYQQLNLFFRTQLDTFYP